MGLKILSEEVADIVQGSVQRRRTEQEGRKSAVAVVILAAFLRYFRAVC